MTPALVSHLLQSTAFAAIAGLLVLPLRGNRAKVRFNLWFCASIKFLIPFALLIMLGTQVQWAPAKYYATPAVSRAVVTIAQPLASATPVIVSRVSETNWTPLILAAIWICGFLTIAAIRLRLWIRIRATLRASRPLQIPAPVEIRSAPGLIEPGVVGWLKPVLLLPEGITEHLAPAELEALLAHELCHIRRRDNLFAAIHMVVEAILWFHPLIWWIGARLVEERERACDEEVLSLGNQPRVYADAIVTVCRLYAESPLACMAGVSGANIRKRIEDIMRNRNVASLSLARKLLVSAAGIAALALPLSLGILLKAGTPAFDAVSITPYKPTGPYSACYQPVDATNIRLMNCTLKTLIKLAYNLKAYQQPSEGPAWTGTDLFVVQAHSGTPQPRAKLYEMLQPVLAERFHLKVHWLDRQDRIYQLKVSPGGVKMRPATDRTKCGEVYVRENVMLADCFSIDDITDVVQNEFLTDHPVVNETGLPKDNFYFFNLTFSRDNNPDAGPSVFSALPDQLGLQITTTRGPVETLILDHVERPTPN
ncbi:MAG TPA: M56 family metallopeptidase [Bryobacteraceae bacterium]|nr:M56 family metallopeptidase [Bryobacteraceae bacterium]